MIGRSGLVTDGTVVNDAASGAPVTAGIHGCGPRFLTLFIIHNDTVAIGRPGRVLADRHPVGTAVVSAGFRRKHIVAPDAIKCEWARRCAHSGQCQALLAKMWHRFIGIPHLEADDGVDFLLRDPAGSAIEVTDEGISSMKAHRQAPHVAKHARTVPAKGQTGTPRTDPVVRTTGGILVVAFALGSLGAGVTELSGHNSTGHASAHQQASNIRLAASTIRISNRPWMY
jgi:hypothetical protein